MPFSVIHVLNTMQHASMSTYPQLLEPHCRRRQLPPTPERRPSSPRMLPTPPPLSPDIRCPSTILERRPSGRLLPRPPTAEPNNLSLPNTPPAVSPDRGSTPDPIPERMSRDQEEPESPGLFARTSPRLPRVSSASGLTRVSPGLTRESSGLTRESSGLTRESSGLTRDSPVMTRLAAFDSLDQAMDTPEGTQSQSSSFSPSMEQLASKSSSDTEDPVSHGLDPSLYGPNASLSVCASPSTSEPPQVPSSSSFSDSEPRPTGLGLLHVSLQHFPVRKRLRVSVLKIEGLAGQLKAEMEIHALCKVSIPGMKSGKEQSSEVKRGRDPMFNQEFFFDNVNIEDLDTKHVFVAAYHQGGAKLGKDILIGDATVPLREIRELNTKKEIKVIEELKQQMPKKLGKIYISSVIEKESKRLTINIKKADDLPRGGFTGSPDVCVKITLAQGAKSQTKSSRVLKSTTTAVYNEAVMFLFNTSKNELDKTKITISVHDMQRTCTGDDVIGCAYLGCLAVDKSEIDQWKNTVEHLGKEYKGTHTLKQHSAAPPVHVAEAGDRSDEE